MPIEVTIPSLGLTMEEGTVAQWLKQEGDLVAKDEPLYVLETDKASMEVGSPAAGTLARVLVPAGATRQVGDVVALLTTSGEQLSDEVSTRGSQPASIMDATAGGAATGPGAGTPVAPAEAAAAPGRPFSSPSARRLARELGVDINGVTGTGPNGRIVEKDIRLAGAAGTAAPAASVGLPVPAAGAPVGASGHTPAPTQPTGAAVPANRYRRLAAARLAESHRTVPPVTLFMKVEMDEAVRFFTQLRDHFSTRHAVKLTWDALVIKAAAAALVVAPYANAQWVDDTILPLTAINVGFAVSLDDGLVVPVVRDADRKTLLEVAREVVRMAGLARENRLQPGELRGAGFTITNLGRYDVLAFTPIINAPESAILGIGQITEEYALVDGQLAPRQRMILSLTFDHRLMDGAPAAQFLQQIKSALEQPYQLLLAEQ